MKSRTGLYAAAAAACTVLAGVGFGQSSELRHVDGAIVDGWFGWSVHSAGDLNLDGTLDMIVGAPREASFQRPESGVVYIFDGRTGLMMRLSRGIDTGGHYGWSVGSLGDVDGDGRPEMIVGEPEGLVNGVAAGSAHLVGSATGILIRTFDGVADGDDMGYSVSGAGDVDGDGVDDVIVGAPGMGVNGDRSGSAFVYSGANGAQLWRFDGANAFDELGWSVSDAGDANGDGFADVVVASPHETGNASSSGIARIFSGFDGSVLQTLSGLRFFERFGHSVSGAGDVDGDGNDDVMVGFPAQDGIFRTMGGVRVFSGATGAVLVDVRGTKSRQALGWAVSDVGDVNGDGVPDVLASSRYEAAFLPSGMVDVYSGTDGSRLLHYVTESTDDNFGISVCGLGDVNGDGLNEFGVGAFQGSRGTLRGGEALVIMPGCPDPATYCFAGANSTGIGATIGHEGGPSISINQFELNAQNVPPGKVGLFYYGPTQIQRFQGNGFRCVGGAVARLGPPVQAGPDGTVFKLVDFTAPPAGQGPFAILAGSTVHFQLWYRDPGGPFGKNTNYSNALTATFCP